jgi:hypothetical protein
MAAIGTYSGRRSQAPTSHNIHAFVSKGQKLGMFYVVGKS